MGQKKLFYTIALTLFCVLFIGSAILTVVDIKVSCLVFARDKLKGLLVISYLYNSKILFSHFHL
jgi:hypothetical protein